MKNISKLGAALIRLLPDWVSLPILGGRLKGMRWTLSSANVGHWLGRYEPECQDVFCKYVSRGLVVYDIGANVGFFTLLAAKLTGPEGKVFSFEPIPANQARLRKNVKVNKLPFVEVVPVCLGSSSGLVRFASGRTAAQHKIQEDGDMEVQMESVDSLVLRGMPPPDFVKIDVEGAESEVLKGMVTLLSSGVPAKMLIEVHGFNQQARCRELLERFGYKIEVIGNKKEWLVDFVAVHEAVSRT